MKLRCNEAGQASIAIVWMMIGAVALAVLLVALAQVVVASARMDGAARLSARALATGDADWRTVAERNGAESVSLESAAGGAERYVSAVTTRKVYGISYEVEGRSPAIAAHGESAYAGSGGNGGAVAEYQGPLMRVDMAQVCPAVGHAYTRMQRAAALDGVHYSATSGYRTYAEQAVLYAQLGPPIAAPPGSSLHHAATELDISVGPAGSPAHMWLTRHAPSYGFIQRYSIEPWHWGSIGGCEVS